MEHQVLEQNDGEKKGWLSTVWAVVSIFHFGMALGSGQQDRKVVSR